MQSGGPRSHIIIAWEDALILALRIQRTFARAQQTNGSETRHHSAAKTKPTAVNLALVDVMEGTCLYDCALETIFARRDTNSVVGRPKGLNDALDACS